MLLTSKASFDTALAIFNDCGGERCITSSVSNDRYFECPGDFRADIEFCAAPGENYYVLVAAQRAGEGGDFIVSFEEGTELCIKPPKAVNVVLDELTEYGAVVGWHAAVAVNIPATSYRVELERAGSYLRSDTVAVEPNGGRLSISYLNLDVDVTYKATVYAESDAGDSLGGELYFRPYRACLSTGLPSSGLTVGPESKFDTGLGFVFVPTVDNAIIKSIDVITSGAEKYLEFAIMEEFQARPSVYKKLYSQVLGLPQRVEEKARLGSLSYVSSFQYADRDTDYYYDDYDYDDYSNDYDSDNSYEEEPVEITSTDNLNWELCPGRRYMVVVTGFIGNVDVVDHDEANGDLETCYGRIERGVRLPSYYEAPQRLNVRRGQFSGVIPRINMDFDSALQPAAPAPPSSPNLLLWDTGVTTIYVRWEEGCGGIGGIDTWRVRAVDYYQNQVEVEFDVDVESTSLFVEGLKPNTFYQLELYAVNQYGASAPSVRYLTTREFMSTLDWYARSGNDRAGLPAYIAMQAVDTDANGNSYTTGYFQSKADFGGGLEPFTAPPARWEGFVAKYNAGGDVQWAVRISTEGWVVPLAITIGTDGVYITGYYWKDALFGAIPLVGNDVYSAFVAKYDFAGDIEWVDRMYLDNTGSNDDIWGMSVKYSAVSDSVFVIGWFDGWDATVGSRTVRFGSSPGLTLTGKSFSNGFVAKYSDSGEAIAAKRIGDDPATSEQSSDIYVYGINGAIDSAGNLYVMGLFSGEQDLYDGDFYIDFFGGDDGFVMRLSDDLTTEWLVFVGGYGKDDIWNSGMIINTNRGFEEVLIAYGTQSSEVIWQDGSPSLRFVSPWSGGYVWSITVDSFSITQDGLHQWPVLLSLEPETGFVEFFGTDPRVRVFEGYENYSWQYSRIAVHGLATTDNEVVLLTRYDGNFIDDSNLYSQYIPNIYWGYNAALLGTDTDFNAVWLQWIGTETRQGDAVNLNRGSLSSYNNGVTVVGSFDYEAALGCQLRLTGAPERGMFFRVSFIAHYRSGGVLDEEDGITVPDACTGEAQHLDKLTDTVFFPDDRDFYQVDQRCSWLIRPSADVFQISLTFKKFLLENEEDYVKIYDGESAEAPLIAVFSGKDAENPDFTTDAAILDFACDACPTLSARSTGPSLFVEFVSSACSIDGGFSFEYESSTIDSHCPAGFTQVRTAESGQISERPKGGYRQGISGDSACSWIILPALPADHVVLEFEFFDLGIGDSIYIYDGEDSNAPLLGRFGYRSFGRPGPVESSSPRVFIQFVSDIGVVGEGFTITYTLAFGDQFCAPFTSLFTPVGAFKSHDPSRYSSFPDDHKCVWEIDAGSSQKRSVEYDSVMVVFQNTYVGDDQLSITYRDVAGDLQVDEHPVAGYPYVSFAQGPLSPIATVDFQAEGPYSAGSVAGFYCFHPAAGSCPAGALTAATGSTNNKFCGNFYGPMEDCDTVIEPATVGDGKVMVVISKLDFANNPFLVPEDVIEVYGLHSSNPTRRFLGSHDSLGTAKVIAYTAENGFALRTRTDDVDFASGYEAHWCVVNSTSNGCEGTTTLSEAAGTFTNSFCHGVPAPDSNCKWTFSSATAGAQVFLVLRHLNFPTGLSSEDLFDLYGTFHDTVSVNTNPSLSGFTTGDLKVFAAGGQYEPELRDVQNDRLINSANAGTGVPEAFAAVVPLETEVSAQTDDVHFAYGFQGEYCIFEPNDARFCDTSTTLTEREDFLVSDICFGHYQPDADCSYTIAPTLAVDEQIMLWLHSSQFGSGDWAKMWRDSATTENTVFELVGDKIHVATDTQGNTQEHPSSDLKDKHPMAFVSGTDDSFLLQLETDNVGFARGFNVSWCIEPLPRAACGGPTYLSEETDTFQYPTCGPAYWVNDLTAQGGLTCEWIIDPTLKAGFTLQNYVIILLVRKTDVGSDFGYWNPDAYLTVKDGDDLIQATYPWSEELPEMVSGAAYYGTSGSMSLGFRATGDATPASGFEMEYIVAEDDGRCKDMTVLQQTSGVVTTQVYGTFYDNFRTCSWLIEMPDETDSVVIRIDEFALETGYDFLEIYDGEDTNAEAIAFLTGSNLQETVYVSSGSKLLLVFRSDFVIADTGFSISFNSRMALEQTGCPLYCSGTSHGTCQSGGSGQECACREENGEQIYFGAGCEVPPAPWAYEAVFGDYLDVISVKFNRPTDKAQMTRSVHGEGFRDCSLILGAENMHPANSGFIGEGSFCVWNSDRQMDIYLGTGATINVDGMIALLGVVRGPNPEAYFPVSDAMDLIVDAPSQLIPPVAVVNGAQSQGNGVDVVADLKSSFIGGDRLRGEWRVSIFLEEGLVNVASNGEHAQIGNAISTANSEESMVLTLPEDTLTGGRYYVIEGRVTNFLDVTGDWKPLVVFVDGLAKVPSVGISGGSLRTVDAAQHVLLISDVRVSDDLLAESGDCPTVDYEWSLVATDDGGVDVEELFRGSTQATSLLMLSRDELTFGSFYDVRVTATLTSHPNQPSGYATQRIQVEELEWRASVIGGDRQASSEQSLELRAQNETSANDLPDGVTVVQSWYCYLERTFSPCLSRVDRRELDLTDVGGSLQVPAAALAPGDYVFGFQSFVAAEGSTVPLSNIAVSRSTVRITLVRSTPLEVEVLGGSSEIKHSVAKPLLLEAAVREDTSSMHLQLEWFVEDGDFELSETTVLSTTTTNATLIIAENAFVEGSVTRLAVRVTDTVSGRTGEASMLVVGNQSPMPGLISVAERSIQSFEDEVFAFEVTGAQDGDGPVFYSFFYRQVACLPSQQLGGSGLCPAIPIAPKSVLPFVSTYLPRGTHTVFCEVSDVFGSVSVTTLSQTVTAFGDDCSLSNYYPRASALMTRADIQQCLQSTQALAQTVNLLNILTSCTGEFIEAGGSATDLQQFNIHSMTVRSSVRLYIDYLRSTLPVDRDFIGQTLRLIFTASPAEVQLSTEDVSDFLSNLRALAEEALTEGVTDETNDAALSSLSNLLGTEYDDEATGEDLEVAVKLFARAGVREAFCNSRARSLRASNIEVVTRNVDPSELAGQSIQSASGGSVSIDAFASNLACIGYDLIDYAFSPFPEPEGQELAGNTVSFSLTDNGQEVEYNDESAPVTIRLVVDDISAFEDPACSFWNETTMEWSSEGCVYEGLVVNPQDPTTGTALCVCSHLTNFGVLLGGSSGGGGGQVRTRTRTRTRVQVPTFDGAITVINQQLVDELLETDQLDEDGNIRAGANVDTEILEQLVDADHEALKNYEYTYTYTYTYEPGTQSEDGMPTYLTVLAASFIGAAVIIVFILVILYNMSVRFRELVSGKGSRRANAGKKRRKRQKSMLMSYVQTEGGQDSYFEGGDTYLEGATLSEVDENPLPPE